MTAPDTALNELRRERREWCPWLSVLQEVLRETENPDWEAAVPARVVAQEPTVPLLAGATLAPQTSAVRGLVTRLIRTASLSGTPKMATLKAVSHDDLDALMLFRASLCQDGDRLKQIVAMSGVDTEALQAVIALVPLPCLHECRKRWGSRVFDGWVEGYCPVCGAWPAFAEVRGIDRSRYYRCGRCGGGWHARCLHCPYCGLDDHDAFVSLVPQKSSSRVIEACQRCLGYVKTFNRLQGCPPAMVMLDDLASVDLDLAALDQGYVRPQGAGYSLDVTLTETWKE